MTTMKERPAVEILLCTTRPRLPGVRRVLLPPMPGVAWVVCCQGARGPMAAPAFLRRPDVRFFALRGTGLARNRNAALSVALGQALLICDDDETLVPDTVRGIPSDFLRHPEWDIVQYRVRGMGKRYPSAWLTSVELAMRAAVARETRFDERFGLGSPCLACGEEEVFVADALARGFSLGHSRQTICRVQGPGTGTRFLSDPLVRRSKGAVFRRTRGALYAYCKCLREAAGWALRRRVNPLPLLRDMLWGVRYAGR